jgi:hypothetical protein
MTTQFKAKQMDLSAYATEGYADAGDAATLAAAEAYTDARVPAGVAGDTLIHNGTIFKPTNFGTVNINTDAAQAPTVAMGHTFFVDATALTVDRSILPSVVGAGEREGITFKVNVPLSGTGKKYSLVCDITLALSQKMMVECIFKSGAWQIGEWKPYTD